MVMLAGAPAPMRAMSMVRRLAAGMTRAGPGERDQPSEDRPEQRQKDDRRIHLPQPRIMFTSSTAIVPRLR